jgi:hypothetical protein
MTESKRPASAHPLGREQGAIRVRFISPTILDLVWTGYITEASCAQYPAQLEHLLAAQRIDYAVFDALRVSGFSADSRGPGGRLLSICKQAGARRVMVVTDSSAIRMIGSTVAFATGMSIRFFATRAEALAAIEQLERD